MTRSRIPPGAVVDFPPDVPPRRPSGMTPAEFAGEAKQKAKRRSPPTMTPRAWAQYLAVARERAKTGDWGDCVGAHLVALYALCHERVYDIPAGELEDAAQRWLAAGAGQRLIEKEFSGDAGRAAEYLVWAWRREEGRARWRSENGREPQRMGWRLAFSKSIVTDYRLAQAQEKKKP